MRRYNAGEPEDAAAAVPLQKTLAPRYDQICLERLLVSGRPVSFEGVTGTLAILGCGQNFGERGTFFINLELDGGQRWRWNYGASRPEIERRA